MTSSGRQISASQLSSLTIFFPACNEEATIAETIRRTEAVAGALTGLVDYEILVVDDGSVDRTAAIVTDWSRTNPRVRLISHPGNLGYGAALCTGYTRAAMDAVFYTDADLPIDFSDLRAAWDMLAACDAVIGYRTRRQDTFKRRLYSIVYNRLIRLLRGYRVRDVNFSFKLIRRSALAGLLLRSRTVYVDGELLGAMFDRQLLVREIPVAYHPRKTGASSFDHPLYALATLLELCTDCLLRRALGPRPRP